MVLPRPPSVSMETSNPHYAQRVLWVKANSRKDLLVVWGLTEWSGVMERKGRWALNHQPRPWQSRRGVSEMKQG